MMHVPEKYRVTAGVLASDARSGNNGAFRVPVGSVYLAVVASDGLGWEHVSVSHAAHIPTWDEMCAIKDLFWDEEDTVYQIHPPRSDYVNCDPNCLHVWRRVDGAMPRPPSLLVGPRRAGKERIR